MSAAHNEIIIIYLSISHNTEMYFCYHKKAAEAIKIDSLSLFAPYGAERYRYHMPNHNRRSSDRLWLENMSLMFDW